MSFLLPCFHILPIYVVFSSAFMQQQAWSVAERDKSTCFSLLSLQYASIPWSSLSQAPSGLSLLFPFSLRAGMLRCTYVRPSYPSVGASRSTFSHSPAYAFSVCYCMCVYACVCVYFISLPNGIYSWTFGQCITPCSSTVFVFPFFLCFFPSAFEITHLIWQFQLCLNYWGFILDNGARKWLNQIGFRYCIVEAFSNNSATTKVWRWKCPF